MCQRLLMMPLRWVTLTSCLWNSSRWETSINRLEIVLDCSSIVLLSVNSHSSSIPSGQSTSSSISWRW
jgi:hypothetical protein